VHVPASAVCLLGHYNPSRGAVGAPAEPALWGPSPPAPPGEHHRALRGWKKCTQLCTLNHNSISQLLPLLCCRPHVCTAVKTAHPTCGGSDENNTCDTTKCTRQQIKCLCVWAAIASASPWRTMLSTLPTIKKRRGGAGKKAHSNKESKPPFYILQRTLVAIQTGEMPAAGRYNTHALRQPRPPSSCACRWQWTKSWQELGHPESATADGTGGEFDSCGACRQSPPRPAAAHLRSRCPQLPSSAANRTSIMLCRRLAHAS